MKEDLSLEDIAGKFSPLPSEVRLSANEMIERKIASQNVLDIYFRTHRVLENFSFEDIFAVHVMNKLLNSGNLNLEEVSGAVNTLQEWYPKFEGRAYELIVIRKLGIAACVLIPPVPPVYFDADSKIIVRTVPEGVRSLRGPGALGNAARSLL